MAHLQITDDTVTIDMSRGEKLEAAHGDQAFPRSAISGVRAVPDCIAEVPACAGSPGYDEPADQDVAGSACVVRATMPASMRASSAGRLSMG